MNAADEVKNRVTDFQRLHHNKSDDVLILFLELLFESACFTK